MSLDKVLHRIQDQINDLAPMLEVFVEDTIQPSVQDCENLQKQLVMLQEQLAIYKYSKQDKELSPSFHIHAKVSAQEKPKEESSAAPQTVKDVVIEKAPEPQPVVNKAEPVVQKEVAAAPAEKSEPVKHRPLVIGINDKFLFTKSLFANNTIEYNAAIEQLVSLGSRSEAEAYLGSLKNLYDWNENSDVVKQFYTLVKKRFD